MLAVRWYLRYALSYRDVEELLAERLFIRPATAKTHVNRAMMKVRARDPCDRTQLVVFAYEHGLMTPGNPVPRPSLSARGCRVTERQTDRKTSTVSHRIRMEVE